MNLTELSNEVHNIAQTKKSIAELIEPKRRKEIIRLLKANGVITYLKHWTPEPIYVLHTMRKPKIGEYGVAIAIKEFYILLMANYLTIKRNALAPDAGCFYFWNKDIVI